MLNLVFSKLNIRRYLAYSLFAALVASAAYSQGRINDKDLEHLMRNLRDDAKSFRSPFKSALNKSTIRKTSKAKDAENLAALFEKQTEALLNNFKKTRKGDSHLDAIRSSAQQLGTIVNSNQLGAQVTTRWEKIQTELQQVLSAYGINTADLNGNPRGVTPFGNSAMDTGSCSQALGQDRADRMVRDCLQVSPATHPPCNAQNSCSLIIDEIKRGCGLIEARNRPAFCDEYR